MGIARSVLLWASKNEKLRRILPRYGFVRKSVSRFMPGEEISDALDASERLIKSGIPTVVTHLGENVADLAETRTVRDHYLQVLEQIQARSLRTQVSVKLTELGLDQDPDLCFENLKSMVNKAQNNFVWIDMESSPYVERTIKLFERIRSQFANTGLCLQAYLLRTKDDLQRLLPLGPAIRLVKGAYAEPPHLAYAKKSDTDDNYFALAKTLLENTKSGTLPAFATHDTALIRKIAGEAERMNVDRSAYEVQMLYGIRSQEQLQLAGEGFSVRVLISYGTYWFPWYMRRLAERPANVWFVLRNITS